MKCGSEFKCPHCRKDCFLRSRSVMEGWTKVGEELVCSGCGEVIVPCEANASSKKTDPGEDPLQGKSARELLSLLGEDSFAEKKTLAGPDDEKRFCKDCKHLIRHPFHCRCSLYDKDVDPMGDCTSFVSAEKK